MKPSLLVLFFTLLFVAPANAEFYKWTDKDGVLHVVDDLHKVPPEERLNLGLDIEELEEAAKPGKKRKVEPVPSKPARPTQATKPTKKVAPEDELFGGKTLDWWTRTFNRLIREKSELERSIAAKEEYKRVYEIGVRLKRKEEMIPESERRYVKEFTKGTIETYRRYKKELPENRAELERKTVELEKLQRTARRAAVPRKIRGE